MRRITSFFINTNTKLFKKITDSLSIAAVIALAFNPLMPLVEFLPAQAQTVSPELTITEMFPADGSTITGNIVVTTKINEVGGATLRASNPAQVTVTDSSGNEELAKELNNPGGNNWQATVRTETFEPWKGDYTITFTAHDSDSNTYEDSVDVTVDNSTESGVPSEYTSTTESSVTEITNFWVVKYSNLTPTDADEILYVSPSGEVYELGSSKTKALYLHKTQSANGIVKVYYLVDGSWNLTTAKYDANGYLQKVNGETIPGYVDTVKPEASLASPAPGSHVRSDTDFRFNVSDSSGIKKVYYNIQDANGSNMTVDGVKTFWMQENTDNTWSYPSKINTTDLPDGTYTFNVRATDNAGNTKYIRPLGPIVIDNTAPIISDPEINPMSNDMEIGGTVRVEFTMTDASDINFNKSLTHVRFLNGRNSEGQKVSSPRYGVTQVSNESNRYFAMVNTRDFVPSSTTADSFRLYIRAEDKVGSGNQTAVAFFKNQINIDNAAPDAPSITKPTSRQWFKSTPIETTWTSVSDSSGIDYYQIAYSYDDEHKFNGSDCPEVTVIDGKSVSGCRNESGTSRNHIPGSSEEGGVTVWIRAVDNVGNASPWSDSVHYYYDHTSPVTDITVSPVAEGAFTVSGDASDNLALNRVYVQLVSRVSGERCGGTTINLIPEGASASWSRYYDITTLGCPEGDYAAHVSVVDRAGNSGSAGWTEDFTVNSPSLDENTGDEGSSDGNEDGNQNDSNGENTNSDNNTETGDSGGDEENLTGGQGGDGDVAFNSQGNTAVPTVLSANTDNTDDADEDNQNENSESEEDGDVLQEQDSQDGEDENTNEDENEEDSNFWWWLLLIALLGGGIYVYARNRGSQA